MEPISSEEDDLVTTIVAKRLGSILQQQSTLVRQQEQLERLTETMEILREDNENWRRQSTEWMARCVILLHSQGRTQSSQISLLSSSLVGSNFADLRKENAIASAQMSALLQQCPSGEDFSDLMGQKRVPSETSRRLYDSVRSWEPVQTAKGRWRWAIKKILRFVRLKRLNVPATRARLLPSVLERLTAIEDRAPDETTNKDNTNKGNSASEEEITKMRVDILRLEEEAVSHRISIGSTTADLQSAIDFIHTSLGKMADKFTSAQQALHDHSEIAPLIDSRESEEFGRHQLDHDSEMRSLAITEALADLRERTCALEIDVNGARDEFQRDDGVNASSASVGSQFERESQSRRAQQ